MLYLNDLLNIKLIFLRPESYAQLYTFFGTDRFQKFYPFATDRSNQKGLFIAVSLTRFHFSRTLPIKKEYDRFTTVPFKPFPDQRWLIFLIFYLKIDYFKFGFSVQMTYSLAELWRNSLATFLWRADWNFVFST